MSSVALITPALPLVRLPFQQETLLTEIVKKAEKACVGHGSFEALKTRFLFEVQGVTDQRDQFALSLQAFIPEGGVSNFQIFSGVRETRTGYQYDGKKEKAYSLAHALACSELFSAFRCERIRVKMTQERGFQLLADNPRR